MFNIGIINIFQFWNIFMHFIKHLFIIHIYIYDYSKIAKKVKKLNYIFIDKINITC